MAEQEASFDVSLHAFMCVGEDFHLVPVKEQERHQILDNLWCACSPTADHDDPRLPKMVQHFSLSRRKWSRVYHP